MARIAVIEDSRFMAKQLGQMLQQAGHDVVGYAYDGQEGIELARRERPEVIMLDITMPNMDGRDCLQVVIGELADIRVIMLSALDDEQIINECLEMGAVGYLTKPPRFNHAAERARIEALITGEE